MKAVVINLTRFGDLLQTQPVVTALNSQGYDTGIICLNNFAGTTRLMRDIRATFSLPGASILASLDRDWRDALRTYEAFCAEVEKAFPPDLVVNLTPSVSARLLALRLGRECEVRGFAMDSFGFNADTTQWAGFLQMASASRGASPFNVVDLFSRVAGIDRPAEFHLADPAPEERIKALKLLENPVKGAEGFIGFQPGASEDRRRWPVARFRELGDKIWKELKRVPVLLGTEDEQELGLRITEGGDFPHLNLMGRTALPELSAVLRRLDLLVTNDTGTMHLASGSGTPVAAVFLATAQPWDTGPASENSVCFEPDLPCHPCPFGVECDRENECRYQISSEAVFQEIHSFIEKGEWGLQKDCGARIYLTGRDSMGFMALSSLSGHDETDRFKWISLQREVYRRFLDGEDLSDFHPGDFSLSVEFISRLSGPLSECRNFLFLLSKQAMLLQADPMEKMKIKFLANFQKIQDILSSCSELSVLSSLWELESRGQESMESLLHQLKRYTGLVSALSAALK